MAVQQSLARPFRHEQGNGFKPCQILVAHLGMGGVRNPAEPWEGSK
jgi:hypothetical protein